MAPTCRCHYGGILIAHRPLGGGRGGAARRAARVRERLSRGAHLPARPARGAARAAGALRGGGAPARRAASGIRPPGGHWRRSRWRGATSRWPRISRVCASRGRTRPIRPADRCSSSWWASSSPVDDLPAARETLDRLAGLAAGCEDERVRAAADFAAGRVLAAEGDERAPSHLKAALERFSAPRPAARGRVGAARARPSTGVEHGGRGGRGGAARARHVRAAGRGARRRRGGRAAPRARRRRARERPEATER